MIDKINKLSLWLSSNNLDKEAADLNDLIKTADLTDFPKPAMAWVWKKLRAPTAPTLKSLGDSVYKIIRYSNLQDVGQGASESKLQLALNIMNSKKYKKWEPKVKPYGDFGDKIEGLKYWDKIRNTSGVESLRYNNSGHMQVDFDPMLSKRKEEPERRRLDKANVKQDLYFSFELQKEYMKDPDMALQAIQNYLKWILKVVEHCGLENKRLAENNIQTYISALKFNSGTDLNALGGSIFNERDVLKIYIVNPNLEFIRTLYNKVLSLKKNFVGFDLNENRDRLARGFDLGDLPPSQHWASAIKKLSFGQILGFRTAFHLLNSVPFYKYLSDDEAGKKEFVSNIKKTIKHSQLELLHAMDKYIRCGVISDVEKILKESGINIR